jgi:hypothetical protein
VPFIKYNYDDQIKKDEISRACNTNCGEEELMLFLVESGKEIVHMENQDVVGWILK